MRRRCSEATESVAFVTDAQIFHFEQHSSENQNRVPSPGAIGKEGARPDLAAESLSEPRFSSEILQCTRTQFFEELLRLRDDERERIGHELHDSAGQLLLYLQLSVSRLKSFEAAESHTDLFDEIQDTVRQISAEIRSLAFLNHPMSVSTGGLQPALRGLLEGFGKRTGFQVKFTSSGNFEHAGDSASLALLRVAQEALVNVHRHARASSVTMDLTARRGRLELMVCDDGIGMPSGEEMNLRGGVGVEGMRFRVEQLGGEFEMSNASPGTKIVANVALTRAA